MPDTTTDLPSTALIAAGKCPGWRRGYGGPGRYLADCRTPGYPADRSCGKKITRGDLCGLHDNVRTRSIEEERRRIAERERELARRQRVTYSMNVSMMLHDTLSRKGAPTVHFDVDRLGKLILDVDDAKALLDWLGRLS